MSVCPGQFLVELPNGVEGGHNPGHLSKPVIQEPLIEAEALDQPARAPVTSACDAAGRNTSGGSHFFSGPSPAMASYSQARA
jgi:hypothetical protein